MKKYSIIVAMLMIFGASISSCSTSGRVRTKHHEVGVGAHVQQQLESTGASYKSVVYEINLYAVNNLKKPIKMGFFYCAADLSPTSCFWASSRQCCSKSTNSCDFYFDCLEGRNCSISNTQYRVGRMPVDLVR